MIDGGWRAADRSPGRWQPDSWLPAAIRPGSETWRWLAIVVRSVRVTLGVALAVAGTGLVGKGIGLSLNGLGLVPLDITQPSSEALAVGVATTMMGGAILGLAVEGAFRSPPLRRDAAPWETLVASLPALVIALWAVERLEGLSARLLPRFSDLFELVPAYLDVVGNRGLIAGLTGLPLIWATLRSTGDRYPVVGANSPALLYACWMALAIAAYRATEAGTTLAV